ncbi:hypothetical protein [Streptomyces sp. NPDC057702]|uniref:hypothetical protein n=1 Tax=unclassified Streptomyces TaxID=2593676 RepID=UPI0036A69084
MSTEPEPNVGAAELAEIRRTVDVGVARIDGQIALLAQRGAQHDRDVTEVTERVRVLEHGRWPLRSLAALTGVCALAVALWQAAGH